MGNFEKKKVGVARLKPTRDKNLKGTRIAPPYFIHQNYIKNTSNLLKDSSYL